MESLEAQPDIPVEGGHVIDGEDNDAFEADNVEGDDELSPTSTSDVKRFVDVAEEYDDDNAECGWFDIRPRFIQCFNNPKGYLLLICFVGAAQSMTVNGLIYVVTTTLERRFHLTSTKSGFISSSYDLTVLIVILFVTYFGEKSHKPRIMGWGVLVFAMGSLLFTVPHYLTDNYDPRQDTEVPTCNINGTDPGECDGEGEESLSKYYGFFISAQVLHGLGTSTMYSLNMVYMDDNVIRKSLPIYIGIYQAMAIFGPAIGFVVGSICLSMYTDVRVDPESLGLTPESPLWVGAWWIPFLIPAGVCLLVFIPVLGFPRSLPGSKAMHRERIETGHKGSRYSPPSGWRNKIKDFPKALWNLVKNIPFMCVCGAICAANFILLGLSVFGPKYMESQYNLTTGQAAMVAGVIVVPAALIGCLIGACLIKGFKLGFRGQLGLCIAAGCVAFISFGAFFIRCPTVPFAGVNVMYNNTNTSFVGDEQGGDLEDTCNEDCNCVAIYDPVCGTNDVLYYSPCHAGCYYEHEVDEDGDGDKVYSECSCIPSNGSAPSQVVTGKCDFSCSEFYVFLGLTFLGFCASFFAIVPQYTMVMRSVGISQRAFALGVSSILYRLLGSVPGPIVFGALIDKSCLIWEEDCEGGRKCWLYDNDEMGMYFFELCAGGQGVSLLFALGGLLTFRPGKFETDDEGGSEKDEFEKRESKDGLSEEDAHVVVSDKEQL